MDFFNKQFSSISNTVLTKTGLGGKSESQEGENGADNAESSTTPAAADNTSTPTTAVDRKESTVSAGRRSKLMNIKGIPLSYSSSLFDTGSTDPGAAEKVREATEQAAERAKESAKYIGSKSSQAIQLITTIHEIDSITGFMYNLGSKAAQTASKAGQSVTTTVSSTATKIKIPVSNQASSN